MPTKNEILNLLWNNPIKIGQWVGFNNLTELHNEWLKSFLFNEEDQTLQGHRGSYKTTTLSLFFALHAIIYPNETLLYFRKTSSDVVEISRQTINILHSGCIQEIVKTLYGTNLVLLKETGTEIQTNLTANVRGTSQIVGLGIGTSITGKHADIVVTDDIVNVNDRISLAERERTKIAYQELQNIKNRGGRFINTGTPWHKEDCFSMMPNISKYDCYQTNLMTKEDIDDLRERMAPSLFSVNYELRYIASEDVIFQEPQIGADFGLVVGGLTHVDSAFYGSDYTAFTCMNFRDGKYYVYGKLWRRHVEELYPTIVELNQTCGGGRLYNERNADKGLVSRDLKNLGVRVYPYDERMNKYIKIVTYLKGIWKDVIFVDGTDPKYIEQICDYTEDAEHDDAPDSCACLARLLYSKSHRKDEYKSLWN